RKMRITNMSCLGQPYLPTPLNKRNMICSSQRQTLPFVIFLRKPCRFQNLLQKGFQYGLQIGRAFQSGLTQQITPRMKVGLTIEISLSLALVVVVSPFL